MYSHPHAELATGFLSLLCFTAGQFTGKPFVLQDWQRSALSEFYGTVDTDDAGIYRHYQYLYLEIPKKNGKTELAAGLGLYHLLGDFEDNPQVYICAADKDNASICYNAMLTMIDLLPWLKKRVKPVPSRREIHLVGGKPGMVKVLSSDAYSKHGYNISCVIFDELHAQPSRELWDIMTFGSGSARRQPVWIVLTTAGDDPDRHSIGWEVHEQCRNILKARDGTGDPKLDNPIWLPIMYGMPDDPDELAKIDIYDEATWLRCNPSAGITVSMRTLRQEAREAKTSEAKERLFRWLRLNQWIATKSVGWLPLTLYDRTQWHVPELEEKGLKGNELRRAMRHLLKGKRCFAGLDLSTTTDLSAFVLEFPPQPGLNRWITLFYAWRPKATVLDAEKRDHVPYSDWERANYISLCEGDMIDFEAIKATIIWASREFDLQILGIDPYLSREISGSLSAEPYNIQIVEVRQNMAELSPPMKDLERKLRSGDMLHEHNTAARWCFGNTRCAVDGNENIKPMKNKSIGRIDITVAWIIAHAVAILPREENLAQQLASGTWTM